MFIFVDTWQKSETAINGTVSPKLPGQKLDHIPKWAEDGSSSLQPTHCVVFIQSTLLCTLSLHWASTNRWRLLLLLLYFVTFNSSNIQHLIESCVVIWNSFKMMFLNWKSYIYFFVHFFLFKILNITVEKNCNVIV